MEMPAGLLLNDRLQKYKFMLIPVLDEIRRPVNKYHSTELLDPNIKYPKVQRKIFTG